MSIAGQKTILIIDDDSDLLFLLQEFLSSEGYQIRQASNGAEGLALASTVNPDLIILDWHMPFINGLETLELLRQSGDQTPVLFMTTFNSTETAVQAFRLGVHHYLPKPFDLDNMRETIAAALHETKLKHEQETLQRDLIAAEAVQQTVVTLAHHINNQLMVVQASFSLQVEMLAQERDLQQRAALADLIARSQQSLSQITAVLTVLQKVTSVETTEYHQSVQMLDIAAALERELEVENS